MARIKKVTLTIGWFWIILLVVLVWRCTAAKAASCPTRFELEGELERLQQLTRTLPDMERDQGYLAALDYEIELAARIRTVKRLLEEQ